jgi:hypothetical protein
MGYFTDVTHKKDDGESAGGLAVSGFKLRYSDGAEAKIGACPDSQEEVKNGDANFWKVLLGENESPEFKYKHTEWNQVEDPIMGYGGHLGDHYSKMNFIVNTCGPDKLLAQGKAKLAENETAVKAMGDAVEKMKSIVQKGAEALKERETTDQTLKMQIQQQTKRLSGEPASIADMTEQIMVTQSKSNEVELLILALQQEIVDTKALLDQ